MCTSWKLQRIMAELTQKEAARAAGMSVRRLSRIEQGVIKLRPDSEEYDRLARAMPVSRKGPQSADANHAKADVA